MAVFKRKKPEGLNTIMLPNCSKKASDRISVYTKQYRIPAANSSWATKHKYARIALKRASISVHGKQVIEQFVLLSLNMKSAPKCPCCGNRIKFTYPLSKDAQIKHIWGGYEKFCSLECADFFYEDEKITDLERIALISQLRKSIDSNNILSIRENVGIITEKINSKNIIKFAKYIQVSPNRIESWISKYGLKDIFKIVSSGELFVLKFLKLNNIDNIVHQDRKILQDGRELDVFLPDFNLAIEYNGIHWHRPDIYGSKTKWEEYHLSKERICKLAGINLLYLWETFGNHEEMISSALLGLTIDNDLNLIYNTLYKRQ